MMANNIPKPSTDERYIQGIVLDPGYDSESGQWGYGYSPDNGAHFFVLNSIYGRKFRQEDADRLYPFLKKYFREAGPIELSLHWADILDKPDLITKQQLDDRLTAFTPAVSWDQVAGKPDLATQDDLKKIELMPGPPGKDGQPGSPGVTPHIDATTGNWFIGTTNTGVKAQGPTGNTGSPGNNGSDGKPGADGVTPHIDSATGHWFVGTTDTGVSARGPQGEQGSPGKDGVTPDVLNLATKTDLANYYTKTETDTKLSTKADQAEYQTLNDKFSNMQIGGRNLLRGTATFEFPVVNNEGTQTIQKYDDETNYIQYTSNESFSET